MPDSSTPAVVRGEPASPPLPDERGPSALDLKMEALAHAVHLATRVLEHGFGAVDPQAARKVREALAREPALTIVGWAWEFERYYQSNPIGTSAARVKAAQDA